MSNKTLQSPLLWRQAWAVIRTGLTTMKRRAWLAVNAVLGTAAVVGVLVVLMSIAEGYRDVMRTTGSPDLMLVMAANAKSEIESLLSADQMEQIRRASGVARSADGQAQVAAEAYTVLSVESVVDKASMNLALRGVQPVSMSLRPAWHVVSGRLPEPGRREVVVGRRAAQQFRSLGVGSRLRIAQGEWQVVGHFEAGGSVVESEVWADVRAMQTAYERGDSVQIARVKLAPGVDRAAFAAELDRIPQLTVKVEAEDAYYADQSGSMYRFVGVLGYGIVFLMSLGAAFAALNSSYAALAARRRELATLGALGFDDRALMLAVALEALGLSLVGGLLGAGLGWLLFDGHTTTTLFFSRDFSQVVFAFHVNAVVLAQAVTLAMALGLAGGCLPAWRHARMGQLLGALTRRV